MKVSTITFTFIFIFLTLAQQIQLYQDTITYPGHMYKIFCENGTILQGNLTWSVVEADIDVQIFPSDDISDAGSTKFSSTVEGSEFIYFQVSKTGDYYIKPSIFKMTNNLTLTFNLEINNSGIITNYSGQLYQSQEYENFIEINLNSSIEGLKILHTFETSLNRQLIFDLYVDGTVYSEIFKIPVNQTSHTFSFRNLENISQLLLLSKAKWNGNKVYQPFTSNFIVSYLSDNSNNTVSNFSNLLSGIQKQPVDFYEINCQAGEKLIVNVTWDAQADLDINFFKGGENFSSRSIAYTTSTNKHQETLQFQVNTSSTYYIRVFTYQIKNIPKMTYQVSLRCGSTKVIDKGIMYKKSAFNFMEFKNSKVGTCQMKLSYEKLNPIETNGSPILFYLFEGLNRTSLLGILSKTSNSSAITFSIAQGTYGIQFKSDFLSQKEISSYKLSIQYATDQCELSFIEFEKDADNETKDQSTDQVNIVAIVVPIACVGFVAIVAAISYTIWKKQAISKGPPNSSNQLKNPQTKYFESNNNFDSLNEFPN